MSELRVATNEKRDGKDHVEWHRVIVWEKAAENCCKYLKKGQPVLVEGRIQTREWTDKAGEKRYATEIVANNVQFLGGPKGMVTAKVESAPADLDIPF